MTIFEQKCRVHFDKKIREKCSNGFVFNRMQNDSLNRCVSMKTISFCV